MKKGFHILEDFFELEKTVWEKSSVYKTQSSFDCIEFGFSHIEMNYKIGGIQYKNNPNRVWFSNMDLKNEFGIDTEKDSKTTRNVFLFRFNKIKVYDIISSMDLDKISRVKFNKPKSSSQKLISFTDTFDEKTSLDLRKILSNLIDLFFQNKSLLRDRLINLKTEELFIIVLQSSLNNLLSSFVSNYRVSHPFSHLIYKINNQLYKNWSVSDLATLCNMSEPSIYRYFQKNFGTTPNKYIWTKKLEKSQYLLRTSPHMNISEIGYAIGIQRPAYFTRVFKQMTGYTPNQYRKSLTTETPTDPKKTILEF